MGFSSGIFDAVQQAGQQAGLTGTASIGPGGMPNPSGAPGGFNQLPVDMQGNVLDGSTTDPTMALPQPGTSAPGMGGKGSMPSLPQPGQPAPEQITPGQTTPGFGGKGSIPIQQIQPPGQITPRASIGGGGMPLPRAPMPPGPAQPPKPVAQRRNPVTFRRGAGRGGMIR